MFSELDSITIIMLAAMALVLGSLLAIRIVQRIRLFRDDLYYINMEIRRSIGAEKVYWKQEKRRLWLTLLPFYRR